MSLFCTYLRWVRTFKYIENFHIRWDWDSLKFPPYCLEWGTMAVHVRLIESFPLRSRPADGESQGWYAGRTARDPYGVVASPTPSSNPRCQCRRWRLLLWRRQGWRCKFHPCPCPRRWRWGRWALGRCPRKRNETRRVSVGVVDRVLVVALWSRPLAGIFQSRSKVGEFTRIRRW